MNEGISRRNFIGGAALGGAALALGALAGCAPQGDKPTGSEGAWDAEVDLLVCGCGGAGMACAVEAKDNGVENVLIIEKGDQIGGTTAMSQGMIAGWDTQLQKSQGVELTYDAMYANLMNNASYHLDPALTKITVAIDRKMRKAFLVTFEKVDANFREIFAMLFPGGQAHLEMTDPEHPAETGIEVVAQPRGKRITKMMLMSGGEKSLTALALLFAVYRTRTVPFYVLDEVEAALDDANLSKLIGALDVLRSDTQLLVISHQRRTMEDADVLYGVSMQADGVSRVVSQKLDRETGKVVNA